MDNHSSHISLEVIDITRDHGISLLTLTLTAATSCNYWMQGFFVPFKKFFIKMCDEWHTTHPGQLESIYYVAELFAKAIHF